MSRTNKGGAGLRLVTGLTAAIALTAGVFAAYAHKAPSNMVCSVHVDKPADSLTDVSQMAGSDVVDIRLDGCSGTYYVRPLNDDISGYATAGIGSANGTSVDNAFGFSSTNTNGKRYIQISTSNAHNYVKLDNPGSTVSGTGVAIFTGVNDLYSSKVDESSSLQINHLGTPSWPASSFSAANDLVATLNVSGLVSGQTYRIRPKQGSTASGWATSLTNGNVALDHSDMLSIYGDLSYGGAGSFDTDLVAPGTSNSNAALSIYPAGSSTQSAVMASSGSVTLTN